MKSQLTAGLSVALLVLAGCAGEESGAEGQETASSAPSSSPSPSPSETQETPSPEEATEPTEAAVEPADGPRIKLEHATFRMPKGFDVDESTQTNRIVGASTLDESIAVVVLGTYGATLDEAARAIVKQQKGTIDFERQPDFELDGVPAYRLDGVRRDKSRRVVMGADYAGVTYNIGFTFDPEIPAAKRDARVESVFATWTWK